MNLPALTHYSHERINVVRPIYSQSSDAWPKPRGFWVSVDSDEQNWRSWCESEDFNTFALANVHEVRLRQNANILLLDTVEAIDEFNSGFGAPFPAASQYACSYILWHRVAARWSGIIIAPYQWSRRLSRGTEWYYGWDCASGCIWDVSVIESIKLREQAEGGVMKLHHTITRARIQAAVMRRMTSLDNPGFCIACGEDAEGVEPDAREYECEHCGAEAVYGADELLLEVA